MGGILHRYYSGNRDKCQYYEKWLLQKLEHHKSMRDNGGFDFISFGPQWLPDGTWYRFYSQKGKDGFNVDVVEVNAPYRKKVARVEELEYRISYWGFDNNGTILATNDDLVVVGEGEITNACVVYGTEGELISCGSINTKNDNTFWGTRSSPGNMVAMNGAIEQTACYRPSDDGSFLNVWGCAYDETNDFVFYGGYDGYSGGGMIQKFSPDMALLGTLATTYNGSNDFWKAMLCVDGYLYCASNAIEPTYILKIDPVSFSIVDAIQVPNAGYCWTIAVDENEEYLHINSRYRYDSGVNDHGKIITISIKDGDFSLVGTHEITDTRIHTFVYYKGHVYAITYPKSYAIGTGVLYKIKVPYGDDLSFETIGSVDIPELSYVYTATCNPEKGYSFWGEYNYHPYSGLPNTTPSGGAYIGRIDLNNWQSGVSKILELGLEKYKFLYAGVISGNKKVPLEEA